MDAWNTRTHGAIRACRARARERAWTMPAAERATLAFLAQHVGCRPLADVRQRRLPGPSVPRALDAGTRALLPLPQHRRQHRSRNWRAAGRLKCWPASTKESQPHGACGRARVDRRTAPLPAACCWPRPGTHRADWRHEPGSARWHRGGCHCGDVKFEVPRARRSRSARLQLLDVRAERLPAPDRAAHRFPPAHRR